MGSSQLASDVSEVFARNLQALVADQPSISAVCRALNINRTQFNRYLSGEAHPRPMVLARICAYFERDARILLTPLAELDKAFPGGAPIEINSGPYLHLIRDFDHNRMPDGLYRLIMPSFTERDVVISALIQLFTLANGGKGVHWVVPRAFAEHSGRSTLWRDRKSLGYCLQHADGMSMIMASIYSRLFMLFFVAPGYRGHTDIYTGYAAITQVRGPDQSQVQPLYIERIPNSLAAALAARRQSDEARQPRLTDLQRHYLETWQPGWTPR